MRRGDSTGGATTVLVSRATVPPVQHSMVLGEGQNSGLEDAVRVRRPVSLEHAGVADVEIEPVILTAVVEDLVVRVADRLILQFPCVLCFARETLGLTGDGEDLASSSPDLLDDSRSSKATQLVAAWRSPQPAVEHQHDKLVLVELGVEPSGAHSDRRVEQRRDQRIVNFGGRHSEAFG